MLHRVKPINLLFRHLFFFSATLFFCQYFSHNLAIFLVMKNVLVHLKILNMYDSHKMVCAPLEYSVFQCFGCFPLAILIQQMCRKLVILQSI